MIVNNSSMDSCMAQSLSERTLCLGEVRSRSPRSLESSSTYMWKAKFLGWLAFWNVFLIFLFLPLCNINLVLAVDEQCVFLQRTQVRFLVQIK